MCNYKLTVTISKNSEIVDGGGWVTSMTWRKSTLLEAKDRAQVLALRDLLNGDKPAVDEDGYLMWDRCYGLCEGSLRPGPAQGQGLREGSRRRS